MIPISCSTYLILGITERQILSEDSLRAKEGTYFGAGLHDEAEDTIGGSSDGKTTHELVAHGLALGGGAETTVGDL